RIPEHRAAADRTEIVVDPAALPGTATPAGGLARDRLHRRLRPIGRHREYAAAAPLAFEAAAGGDEIRLARDADGEPAAGAGGSARHGGVTSPFSCGETERSGRPEARSDRGQATA